MELIIEILKFTLPSLIVFLTTYFLFKNYFDFQSRIKMMELRQADNKITLPLRLQSYERLSLFTERIAIENLIARLRTTTSTNQSLQYAMLISIQQEYEHNISQQIYVSDSLWHIIKLSKDNTAAIINQCAEGLDPQGNAEQIIAKLFDYISKNPAPTSTALSAIRSEAGGTFS